MRRLTTPTGFAAVMVAMLLLAGCAPSLSPLYRDFTPTDSAAEPPPTAVEDSTDERALLDRTARALRRADWTPAPGPHAATTLQTEPRTVSNIGLYRTEVTLEAVPLRGGYVRVYIHPYRHYLIGGRSKVPYLNAGLRRTLLPELEAAFEAEGLRMLGTARSRDDDQT